LNKTVLLLTAVVVAALLAWLGIRMFRAEPAAEPAAIEAQPVAKSQPPTPSEVAPIVSDQPLPGPPPTTKEVIPDASRNALNTISGTIRVSIRVIVAKDGTVLAATADEPVRAATSRDWPRRRPSNGSSRRALPTSNGSSSCGFYFKRSGVTARVAD
jgi:hypothetical protein